MGQEFSTIVQIIVKAVRGKAIAWRSVSCKMTCYYIPDVKLFRFSACIFYPLYSLQSIFCIQSAVCYLHFVLTGIRGTNTVYFWLGHPNLMFRFPSPSLSWGWVGRSGRKKKRERTLEGAWVPGKAGLLSTKAWLQSQLEKVSIRFHPPKPPQSRGTGMEYLMTCKT